MGMITESLSADALAELLSGHAAINAITVLQSGQRSRNLNSCGACWIWSTRTQPRTAPSHGFPRTFPRCALLRRLRHVRWHACLPVLISGRG